MKFSSILLLISLLSSTISRAEKLKPQEIQLSFIHESVSLPLQSTLGKNKPLHPGLSMGANWFYKNRGKNYYFLNASLAYFYHQNLYSGMQLYSSWNARHSFSPSFNVGMEVGLGYMQKFGQLKEFQNNNGTYTQTGKLGRASFLFLIGFQTNWYPRSFFRGGSFFLKYQIFTNAPFAEKVPVLPSISSQIGITYPISKLRKSNNE